MSYAPFRKVRAKRALEVSETPDELDFDSVHDTAESDEQPSAVKRGFAALAVSSLALLTVGGIAVAASAGSDKVDTSAVSADKNARDITRGAPAPDAMTIEQQVQAQVKTASKTQGQTNGILAAFAGRTTVTRSAARTELSRAVANTDATQRKDNLVTQAGTITAEATDASAAIRDDQIAADLARAKAEAGRIAEEKKKAEAKLKAAEAAKKSGTARKKDAPNSPSVIDTTGISGSGGATPIAPGHYIVGASFGEYGSWARWHTGQDFPAPIGTPIRAVADGMASTTCGCQGWAGSEALVIHHGNGGSTLYAHMGSMTVSPGQMVKAGQVVGYVGMKGRTLGPHLHFEYYPSGTVPGNVYSATNPVTFLLSLGVNV